MACWRPEELAPDPRPGPSGGCAPGDNKPGADGQADGPRRADSDGNHHTCRPARADLHL